MVDVDTQDILGDIRSATQSGERNRLFYLHVATPGGAPKAFHNQVIIPFLKIRGWQKVSYRNTGFRALYFLHDKDGSIDLENDMSTTFKCVRCKGVDNNNNFQIPAKKSRRSKTSVEATDVIVKTSCSNCASLSPTHRACQDRNDLKVNVENYKKASGGTFQVHIILSQPVDYEEDFLEFASQPGAVED
uniref:Uncharacterized protein LOC100177587 n=1 Tax=Phallusia mammillata TaxID=59560 RepID=A0A6F9DHF4_9ASCI|nr:uncharacterized protein LOC100177587 [Phallusia mammillata]